LPARSGRCAGAAGWSGTGSPQGLTSGVSFGALAATTFSRIALWNTLPNGKRATIYTIYTIKSKHPEWFREDLALLLELLAEGRIQPIVSQRLPLEEVVRTHELMESAGARGKIVLLPNG
jgi:NADPH:quinone reductase-like Zn-dependent oxidoreductase